MHKSFVSNPLQPRQSTTEELQRNASVLNGLYTGMGNAALNLLNPMGGMLAPAIRGIQSIRKPLEDAIKAPVQPSAGWTDAVQAQNNAIASGTQLAPNRPAGTKPGELKPVEGAVDARGGNSESEAAPAPAPTTTGRQSKRVSPSGVEQTGTQTGIKPMTMDDVNSALGGSVPIRSVIRTHPTICLQHRTMKCPILAVKPRSSTQQRTFSLLVTEWAAEMTLELCKLAAGFDMGKGLAGQIDGAPVDSNVMKGIKAGKEADTGATPAESSGLEAYAAADPASYAISNEEMQRRRSFLDAKDSMTGLRNIEADQGIYVAGGKYHHVNPNAGKEGQNDFIEISKDNRDTIMRGGEGAEQLRKSFVDRINDKGDDAPAAPEVSETFADAPQILESPVRQGGDNTAYFQTPTGSTVESSTDFTDPPKVDMNGMEDYRKLADKVNGNPYLR